MHIHTPNVYETARPCFIIELKCGHYKVIFSGRKMSHSLSSPPETEEKKKKYPPPTHSLSHGEPAASTNPLSPPYSLPASADSSSQKQQNRRKMQKRAHILRWMSMMLVQTTCAGLLPHGRGAESRAAMLFCSPS